jgi:phosphate uptake regulator
VAGSGPTPTRRSPISSSRPIRVSTHQREIEDLAVMTIARRQLVAVDLRKLIGGIRVASDL